MKVYSVYFSPTNHTKEIVNYVAKEFGNPIEIDLTKEQTNSLIFSQDDLVVLGVPSYGGRVPAIALERMKEFYGTNTHTVCICSYGNRAYEDTLKELSDTLRSQGFICMAAIAAVAEHSIMHQYATGRPNAEDYKELKSGVKEILKKLQSKDRDVEVQVPGNKPYREYKGIPLKPKTSKKCTGCMTCANLCPVGAISFEDPKKTDTKLCISCMRCLQVCPQKARHVNSMMLKVASKKVEAACKEAKNIELFI